MTRQVIFISGSTGYMGKRLAKILVSRGHKVIALTRKGSENKLDAGCEIVYGNALDGNTFKNHLTSADTFVHLVGVAHPGPKKKDQFISIDLASIKASLEACKNAEIKHFIYLSVAQTPTKIMQDYQRVRAQGEELIRKSRMYFTFIRPWYVTGPGHYWPLLLLPLFKLLEWIPSTRDKAKKLALVSINQMLNMLTYAVENPSTGERIIEINEIKKYNP